MHMNISEDLLSLLNNQFHPDLEIYSEDAGHWTVVNIAIVSWNATWKLFHMVLGLIVTNFYQVTPQ